ncbi:arylsulfatase [Nisaea nitritireducens]|uniref:arylsulfatase n=1 Tax=Nisaea nitritireducens TaxID=568392 RepID=UPI001868BEE6|nr:arylsulfatase [Nisaea nitritireducens]
MPDPVRLSLIHATRLAIDPVEAAFREAWPEAEILSLLDEGLSVDRAKDAALTPELAARIITLARYAEGTGPAGILYTCSAFGEAIEEAARTSPLPVLKPNEAMFEEAFGHGPRVAMIYTFPAAADGMADEFREEAARRDSGARLTTVFAEGAREALNGGDADTHNRLIAEAVARTADEDVFLLAHFSMAPAAPACRAVTDRPILTAPEAAVRKMKALVEAREGAG